MFMNILKFTAMKNITKEDMKLIIEYSEILFAIDKTLRESELRDTYLQNLKNPDSRLDPLMHYLRRLKIDPGN